MSGTKFYRRGAAVRVVERFDSVADPDLAAQSVETGPYAWLNRVEAGAADVLTRGGYQLLREKFGLVIVPDERGLPDLNALDTRSRAACVLAYAHIARRALAGSNVASSFEWGAKLMAAASGLELELAGWPMAAHWGRLRKSGHDSTIDSAARARSIRWRDEVERGMAGGQTLKETLSGIADREGVSFETVKSAVARERKRCAS